MSFSKKFRRIDLAHWAIQPDSATIFLTHRSSIINENDPDLEPSKPIMMSITGIIKPLNAINHTFQKSACYEIWDIIRNDFEQGQLMEFLKRFIRSAFKRKLRKHSQAQLTSVLSLAQGIPVYQMTLQKGQ